MQVKLCDPCLSALEVVTTMCYTDRRILYDFIPGETGTDPLLTEVVGMIEWLWFKRLEVDIDADEQTLQLVS